MKKIREKKKKEKTEATAVSRADDAGRLLNEEVTIFWQLRRVSSGWLSITQDLQKLPA